MTWPCFPGFSKPELCVPSFSPPDAVAAWALIPRIGRNAWSSWPISRSSGAKLRRCAAVAFPPSGSCAAISANMINIEDATYFENPRWAETNMVMSLVAAAAWLRSDSVVISYADIFYGRDVVRRPGRLIRRSGGSLRSQLAQFVDPAVCRSAERRGNISDGCARQPDRDRKANHANRGYRRAVYGVAQIHARRHGARWRRCWPPWMQRLATPWT